MHIKATIMFYLPWVGFALILLNFERLQVAFQFTILTRIVIWWFMLVGGFSSVPFPHFFSILCWTDMSYLFPVQTFWEMTFCEFPSAIWFLASTGHSKSVATRPVCEAVKYFVNNIAVEPSNLQPQFAVPSKVPLSTTSIRIVFAAG